MREIGALEAAGQLGALLDLVEQGEEVMIIRGGRVVARLVPGVIGQGAGPDLPATQDQAPVSPAVAEARRLRAGVTLGPGVTIRDLIYDGRR